MILLTFQPKNCLADCLSKASAKADNLITAVKTGRLLDVDIHPNFRTLMEHKAVLSTWCRTFTRTREEDISFLSALRVSLAPTPREGPFHVMFVRNQHIDELNELNTCEFQNQDATKITSALADSRNNFSWTMTSLLVRTLCLCIALMTIFLRVSPLSPSIVTMSSSEPIGVGRVDRWNWKAVDQHLENLLYEALALSRTTLIWCLMRRI